MVVPWCLALVVVSLADGLDGGGESRGLLRDGWAVGDQIGVRLVGGSHETGNASFWIAAPVGSAAWSDANFGVVSASLWLRGRWGGAESIIAAAIFEAHCGEGGLVLRRGRELPQVLRVFDRRKFSVVE